MVRVFDTAPGDLRLIPGRVITKTQKAVFDASLLNTDDHKIEIEGKKSNPRKWLQPLPYISV